MSILKRKPLTLITSIFGLMTILLGLILLSILPSKANLSDGYRTPVIAFEFARVESDLSFLSGTSAVSQKNRKQMVNAHSWDMVFPFAYGGLLFLLLLGLFFNGFRLAALGLPISLLAIYFDLVENFTLLEILQILNSQSVVGEYLASLYPITWLKWGSIAICIFIISIGLFLKKEYYSFGIGVAASLTSFCCWFLSTPPLLAELMSLLIAIFFVWVSGKTFLSLRVQYK